MRRKPIRPQSRESDVQRCWKEDIEALSSDTSDTSDAVFAENPVNSGNYAGCGPLEIGARILRECVLVPRTQPHLRQLVFSLSSHTQSARTRIKIGTFETFDSPTSM